MPERGDLLLVPFPFSDLTASKRRPILVLTAADNFGDFIALPVTSRPQTANAVPLAQSDLTAGSLPTASWIRTNRIVTINASLVVKTLGHVSDSVVDAAIEQFCAYLGFKRPAIR
jgi:mRNA interferase MazF